MRVRDDLDQKLLAELFYQYLNVEEDFIRDLFGKGETRLGRVFVNETAVPPELSLHVLDYERASEVAKTRLRHRRGPLLLPAQEAARRQGVRRAAGHLPDVQRRRLVSDEARRRAEDRHRRVPRPAAAGARPAAGAVRRERARARVVHLQLLRLLLRGAAGGAALRVPPPGPHQQLRARRSTRRTATAAASAWTPARWRRCRWCRRTTRR